MDSQKKIVWKSIALDMDKNEQVLVCNGCRKNCQTRIEYEGEYPEGCINISVKRKLDLRLVGAA